MQTIKSKSLFGFLFLLLAEPGMGAKSPLQPGQLPVTEVQRLDLVQKVTVAGSVFPFRRTVIAPPYNAYVKKIFVTIGQTVKAGDPIVSLTQSLREFGDTSYPLRAPFPGTVVQINKSEGEFVETTKETNSMIRIDDVSRLFVRSEVPENEISKIKKGQEVVIKVNGLPNKTYKGELKNISLAAKEKERWGRTGDRVDFDVEVEILDKDSDLLPGMSALLDIVTQRKEKVLTIPLEYVQRKKDGYLVTLENGKEQKVEVGMQSEQHFEILSGLQENQKVRMVDFYNIKDENI